MQTLYYTTSNFIRHTGNVVDLQEYRRRLELANGPECRREEEAPRPQAKSAPRRRRSRGMTLDYCASLGVLIMTLTFTVRILCL